MVSFLSQKRGITGRGAAAAMVSLCLDGELFERQERGVTGRGAAAAMVSLCLDGELFESQKRGLSLIHI